MSRRRWWRRDDGSAALETAILAPPMLTFIAMAVIGMRVEVAGGSIEGAAHDAARAASLASDSSSAYVAATTTAHRSLDRQNLHCSRLNIVVDTSGFAKDPGEAATVAVTITCRVTFADVAAPGMPGSKRLRASFVAPIDTYRSRS